MELKLGGKVRIRDWDDMIDEFGIDSSGDIPCNASFSKNMRGLCSKIYTISSIRGRRLEFEENISWHISFDMVEEVLDNGEKIKLPVIVVALTSAAISRAINDGYAIREFHNNKCIVELEKTIGVIDED